MVCNRERKKGAVKTPPRKKPSSRTLCRMYAHSTKENCLRCRGYSTAGPPYGGRSYYSPACPFKRSCFPPTLVSALRTSSPSARRLHAPCPPRPPNAVAPSCLSPLYPLRLVKWRGASAMLDGCPTLPSLSSCFVGSVLGVPALDEGFLGLVCLALPVALLVWRRLWVCPMGTARN